MSRYGIHDLARGLKRLGLKKGDMVLVRAALRSMGELDGTRSTTFIKALLEVVGSEGTIVGLSFNNSILFPRRKKNIVITPQTPPDTGGMTSTLVDWPGAIRSLHPTNSFVAIGRLARGLVAGHDENTTCFHPIDALMEYNGKMILVGCVDSSPGFSTVHRVQERLGLATRSILKGREGFYFEREGEVRLFRRLDVPGCSNGYYKFYSHYVREGKLTVGAVGDAYSVSIIARDAFDIEYPILEKEPKFALCDDPGCFSCRGTRLYNLTDMPKFYTRQLPLFVRYGAKRLLSSMTRAG